MNRAEVIRQVLLWEQAAGQALQRAAAFRALLQADADAEYAEQGTAPTWRLPQLGQVVLPVSKPSVTVRDEEALAEWASLTHPTEVELRVRPAYLAALKRSARIDGDVAIDKDGTVIPGLSVRDGGQPGSVRLVPEPEAKEVAAEAAGKVLDLVATSLHLPAAPEFPGGEVPDAPEA